MADIVRAFLKKAAERRRLYLDYSAWLEDAETLTDSQASVSPYDASAPILINTSYTDMTNKKLTMFVSGGLANKTYTIRISVRTNEGQVKIDDISLKVTL